MYAPCFEISADLLGYVAQASEIKAWLDQALIDVPWLPAFQRESAARVAHSSTAIEGNPLTLPEVEALARGEDVGAAKDAKREVVNYLAAMRWIWKRRAGDRIEEAHLLRLHRLLTAGTLAEDAVGAYKQRPNRVVDAAGRTIYTPPPAKEAASLTGHLLTWVNSREVRALHPIVVSAIAHHRLVSIHPFSDGNGRTARALGFWLLYTRGFDTHHLLTLDEYFEQDRQLYYAKLQQARDLDNVLTYWVEYVAQGVVKTLETTKRRIHSLSLQRHGEKVTLTKRQEDVLRFLRDKGRVGSSAMEEAFRITRARVSQIVKPLVEKGLVVREGQTRATTYRLAEPASPTERDPGKLP